MGSKATNRRFVIGVIATLGGAVLWGFSGSCAQLMLGGFGASVLFITAVRAVIAAVLLMGLALVRYRREVAEILRCGALRVRLVLFGVGLFLSQSTFACSVAQTNAGTATVLQSLATVFVMVLACAIGRRLPRVFEVLGLICALVSTWLIATQGNPGEMQLPLGGLLWGLANAGAVTLYIMVPKPLYQRWPSIPVIGCGMVVAAVVACVIWVCAGLVGDTSGVGALLGSGSGEAEAAGVVGVADGSFGIGAPALDGEGWLVLVVGIGVLGTACAFGLYLYGVAIVGSIRGSLLGAAEPASAMMITTLWLGTAFSCADWLGLVLMVAMISLVALSQPKGETALPAISER